MKRSSIPKDSVLSRGNYNYFDSYEEQLYTQQNIVIEDIARSFFLSAPPAARKLMTLRNSIVGLLNLKTGIKISDEAAYLAQLPMKVGDKIGLFEIMEKSENEIVMGTDDSHLDFRVSLFKNLTNTATKSLSMTTTVQFNNKIGKLYFIAVGPFHRWIAPNMLKRMAQSLSNKVTDPKANQPHELINS